jgi:RND superfamily putative drug exporter
VVTHKVLAHPGRVLLAAVALTLLAGVLAGGVTDRLSDGDNFDDPASPSAVGAGWVKAATGYEATPSVVALVARDGGSEEEVARIMDADPGVGLVERAGEDRPGYVSRDGSEALVAARLRPGGQDDTAERLGERLDGLPGVTLGGSLVAGNQVGDQVSEDLAKAEMLAFPLLFGVSLFIFRGVVAALLPLLVGAMTIAGAFAGLRMVDEVLGLSVFALNLVIGLGLGLAIDYSLLVLSRYREELEAGHDRREAVRITMRTAGRTIVYSSLTVAAALASLLVFPQPFLYSMGVGGTFVALLAATVSVVVLPAMLLLLGTRVDALSPARFRRRAAGATGHGAWYRLAHGVMRRPVPVAAGAAVAMIAIGLPALGVKFASIDATALPPGNSGRTVANALDQRFADRTSPVVAVVRAGADERAEIDAYAGRLEALGTFASVGEPRRLDADTWRIDAITGAPSGSERSRDAVRRAQEVPAPFPAAIMGITASFVDQQASLGAHLLPAGLIVAVATLLVLFLMTGSVVLPLKALVMNVLTLAATFGMLVLVFQEGRLEGLLDFSSPGALEATQPIVLAAMAFGLSTDYGVFLLGRIKEERDRGASEQEAVAIGVERTGRIVTAAALLFCIAIGAFATSELIFIKELGLGTAFAVAIDATIVRALLVPSLMALLGRRNWWAPGWLRTLHARIAPAPA